MILQAYRSCTHNKASSLLGIFEAFVYVNFKCQKIMNMIFNQEELDEILKNEKISKKNDGELVLRFNCIQSYYLRISWHEKLVFLKELFEEIKEKESIRTWFEIIHESCFDKISVYCELVSFTDVPTDNILLDNNRSLDTQTIALSKKNDLAWFRVIDDENQEIIFFSLAAMGGSALMKTICEHIYNFYKLEQKKPVCLLNPVKAPKPPTKTKKAAIENTNNVDPEEDYVIRLRKEWDDSMLKYQKSIEKKMISSKDTKKNSKKSKESSKNSNKNDKKNTGIDYVQTLPVWVVKKIFSLLDKKTLNKIKDVNLYWSYAVDSYDSDLKARKSLNNFINSLKIKSEPNLVVSKKAITLEPKPICKKTIKKDTLLKMEGTCSKAIREPMIHNGEKCVQSLLTKATHSLAVDYLVPINEIKVFPRKPPKAQDKYSVHQSPTCIKHEAGIKTKKNASQNETKPDLPIELGLRSPIESKPSMSIDNEKITDSEVFSNHSANFDP